MPSSQNLLLPFQQILSNLGIVGSGYKVYTYQTGTSTPLITYSDINLTIPNTNPLVTIGNGRFATQAWVVNKNIVKVVLTDSDDVVIQTIDPVDNFSNGSLNTFNPIPAVYIGTTAGTNTAYTLASNIDISQVGYSSSDVFMVTFDEPCGAAPTLAIDGLAALPLVKYTGQGTVVALQEGDVQNQRYFITISGSQIIVFEPKSQPIYVGFGSTLTIASGVITITNGSSNYLIDNEAAAATDSFNTINGGTDGEIIILGSANSARVPTIESGSGNILLTSGQNFELTTTANQICLKYRASDANWIEQFSSPAYGSVLQIVKSQLSTYDTTNTTFPNDNTPPTNTEGEEFTTVTVTPKSSLSVLEVTTSGFISNDGTNRVVIALFIDSTVNALTTAAEDISSADRILYISTQPYYVVSTNLTSRVFKMRYGASAGITAINGGTVGAVFGGTLFSGIVVKEILTSLA